ncbi:MAG: glycosyltransferase family 2 protein [Bacteroidota bacterium]
MNGTPKVSIVILNWNGAHHLRRFLPAVQKTTYPNVEIVVADNGSSDDSLTVLHNEFPAVRVIKLDRNHGFAEGYNLALQKVEADYFMILNSDVLVSPPWLGPMVSLLESNKEIAACQPKILSLQQPDLFDYAGAAGGWLNIYGYPFAKGRIFDHCEADTGQYDDSTPIFWASGAALFIRSSVFKEVGGFDPFFFAHQEEIDLCWRIQRKGYQIHSCPGSVVHHLGGGTLPRGNSLKTYLNFRNNHIMLFKNLSFLQKIGVIPMRFALDGLSAWKGLFGGDPGYFFAIFRAHMAFVGWLFTRSGPYWTSGGSKYPLRGLYFKNVVWQHFVRGRNKFSEFFSEPAR